MHARKPCAHSAAPKRTNRRSVAHHVRHKTKNGHEMEPKLTASGQLCNVVIATTTTQLFADIAYTKCSERPKRATVEESRRTQ